MNTLLKLIFLLSSSLTVLCEGNREDHTSGRYLNNEKSGGLKTERDRSQNELYSHRPNTSPKRANNRKSLLSKSDTMHITKPFSARYKKSIVENLPEENLNLNKEGLESKTNLGPLNVLGLLSDDELKTESSGNGLNLDGTIENVKNLLDSKLDSKIVKRNVPVIPHYKEKNRKESHNVYKDINLLPQKNDIDLRNFKQTDKIFKTPMGLINEDKESIYSDSVNESSETNRVLYTRLINKINRNEYVETPVYKKKSKNIIDYISNEQLPTSQYEMNANYYRRRSQNNDNFSKDSKYLNSDYEMPLNIGRNQLQRDGELLSLGNLLPPVGLQLGLQTGSQESESNRNNV